MRSSFSRTSFPQTIDISAEPTQPTVVVSRVADSRSAINQTLGADAFLLVGSLLIGIVCSGVVSVADASRELASLSQNPLPLLLFLACGAPALIFLLSDVLRASRYPARMPFTYSLPRTKAIYAKRVHLALLAIYFSAILAAFCWSVPSMLLFSKLFVAAVFAIALYALGQSISARRRSFVITGSIFLVVLAATQLFLLVR